MSKRSRLKRDAAGSEILVEDSGHDAWNRYGRRLFELDAVSYRRLLALAQAFVALHGPELESDEAFASRCVEIAGGAKAGQN